MLIGGITWAEERVILFTIIKPLHHKQKDRKAKSDREEAKQLINKHS